MTEAVTVRCKTDEDYLEAARHDKVEKHRPFVPTVGQEFGGTEVLVFGLPVGSGDKCPPGNFNVLKRRGLRAARRRSLLNS